MRYRIVPGPSVEAELEEAFCWIAQDAPGHAIDWYNGCLAAIESLSSFPQRCAVAPESEAFDCEVRQLLHGNYRILFTIQEQAVYLLHVRHGARRHLMQEDET